MNNIKRTSGGRESVVFDDVIATFPGGVQIDNEDAKKRFTDGVVKAGTVVVPHANGTYKVLNTALSDSNLKGSVGLVRQDVRIEDFTLSSVVIAGTARKNALPDLEKTGVEFLAKALPRITFY